MKKLILLLLPLLWLGCGDDDDSFKSINDCDDAKEIADDCSILSNLTMERYQRMLIGTWALEATYQDVPLLCEFDLLEDQPTITYSPDSTYLVEYEDGTTERGEYFMNVFCGVVPPCVFLGVGYIGERPSLSPVFTGFCGDKRAVDDARSVDGDVRIYRKVN